MELDIRTALSESALENYMSSLSQAGKSKNTMLKYRADLEKFMSYVEEQDVSGENVLVQYQKYLLENGYGNVSVNSYVGSAYRLCTYLALPVIRPEMLRKEESITEEKDEELTLNEYQRLLRAAFRYDMEMIGMMLQVLAGTTLRYGEMEHITVEALENGGIVEFERRYKSSVRKKVKLPEKLVEVLLEYARGKGITSGILFRNREGRFPNRSNVWRTMKRLCAFADVKPEKVSPQKIKNGFAKDFYSMVGKKRK